MKLINKNFFKTLLVIFSLFFFNAQLLNSSPHHHAPDDHETRGVPIKNGLIELLNMQFTENPEAILRINLANNSIKEISNKIHKDENTGLLDSVVKKFDCSSETQSTVKEKLFVQEQLKNILDPVKKFFDNILGYSKLIEPIIKESLANHPHIPIEQSFLVRFFKTQIDIQTFCKTNIQTREDLKKLCSELLSFFNDLNASLSKEANQAYKKLIQKMHNAKDAKKKSS